jgi:hypothetical protein
LVQPQHRKEKQNEKGLLNPFLLYRYLSYTMEIKLTDSQIRGIDLSVKALKKVFPFVTGWKLDDTWGNYETKIYLDLFIDYQELSKIVDLKIRPYFINKIESGEVHTSSAILGIFEWGDYQSEDWEKISQLSFDLSQKINSTLNQAYGFMPDEMKIYWNTSSSKHVSSLGIDEYIFKS